MGRCFEQASPDVLGKIVFDYLQNVGYLQAFVLDPTVRVLNETLPPHPAVVVLDIQTGPPYRISSIVITGNRWIDADELRGFIPINPGDVLDASSVQNAMKLIAGAPDGQQESTNPPAIANAELAAELVRRGLLPYHRQKMDAKKARTQRSALRVKRRTPVNYFWIARCLSTIRSGTH